MTRMPARQPTPPLHAKPSRLLIGIRLCLSAVFASRLEGIRQTPRLGGSLRRLFIPAQIAQDTRFQRMQSSFFVGIGGRQRRG